jgi:D-alanine--D-alanine ligase
MAHAGKVAVLMGGPSGEHDISLKSGQGVVKALERRGWDVEPVVIPKLLSTEQARAFTRLALHNSAADVAFIALHGPFGEDGTVQQVCEDLPVAYTGSGPEASRLGMDKVASRRRFEQAGLRVPAWAVLDGKRLASPRLPAGWSFPIVVKPSDQGSSLGVALVRTEPEFHAAVKAAAALSPQVILEQFVAGREVTAGVLGDDALPVVEIRPGEPFFDFKAKYTTGATQYLVPAPISESAAAAVQAAGLEAHRVIGCRYLSRTDIILDAHNEPVVLEVNTIPGFTPTSLLPKAAACAGLSYEDVCERLVQMARQVPSLT